MTLVLSFVTVIDYKLFLIWHIFDNSKRSGMIDAES